LLTAYHLLARTQVLRVAVAAAAPQWTIYTHAGADNDTR